MGGLLLKHRRAWMAAPEAFSVQLCVRSCERAIKYYAGAWKVQMLQTPTPMHPLPNAPPAMPAHSHTLLCVCRGALWAQNGVSFHDTLDRLLPRPWVVDCLDALLDRLTSHTYRKAVLFVDNSGADVILGECTPACMCIARIGQLRMGGKGNYRESSSLPAPLPPNMKGATAHLGH